MHHRLTPIEAARPGKGLEPFRLFWIEDGTPAENQEAFRLIRHHTTTPLAVGKVFNSNWDCKDMIQNQLIDCVSSHGVDINEALAVRYPYRRGYLPVNRLERDGTLWNW